LWTTQPARSLFPTLQAVEIRQREQAKLTKTTSHFVALKKKKSVQD
jgi:hypothetical protein